MTAAIGVLEVEAALDVVSDLAIVACALRTSGPSPGSAPPWSGLAQLEPEPPEPSQEAKRPVDAGVLPLLVLVGRRHEEDVEANGVGAVAVDHRTGATTFPFDFDIFAPGVSASPG